jgi:ADP-heptose:LPS heptosyltransferase
MMSTRLDTATPDELVAEFLGEFGAAGGSRREVVARLVGLAASDHRETAESATRAFFTSLVERLADSFSPPDVALYNRVFAQAVEYCRRLDRGRAIDEALHRFGLHDEADVLGRAEALRHKKSLVRRRAAGVRRVVVLSRVTLGADVAITSVIINRFEREFPDAEIVLVGGRKAAELFGGDPRITFHEIDYRRGATTLERLLTWPDVVEVVRAVTANLSPAEWLIVDPDSRLTQLGLLPLTECEENYIFFPSREYGSETNRALAQLAAAWLDEVFGSPSPTLPRLSLRREDTRAASALLTRLRQASARPVVAVNFGVGANPAKRAGDEFEQGLVSELIRRRITIVFDKGAGAEETRRADAVIARAQQDAAAIVVKLTEQNFAEAVNDQALGAQLLVWDGGVGRLAALVAQSDLYVGYDSAGQHIAAAAGTPCIDVFAGYSSPRMLDRWRPAGSNASALVVVEPGAGRVAGVSFATFSPMGERLKNGR